MAESYTRDHLKVTVVKLLQTLGWNSINSTPLEMLTDILGNYMNQIARSTTSYANEFGCTQPNLDHLGLAFSDLSINVSELEEYVKYVNFGPTPAAVPKYPLPKDDHLNFLKPGSKEVITRPVHIHEHLPPMHPLLEGAKSEEEALKDEPMEGETDGAQVFKKPADISPSDHKRPNLRREEEGSRPTREISSVMMTTSGFLSPAREGKLPEARTPLAPVDPPLLAPPPTTPPPNPAAFVKKPTKLFKPKNAKRKPKSEAIEPTPTTVEAKKRKLSKGQPRGKKALNKFSNSLLNAQEGNNGVVSKSSQPAKVNKALAAARLKTEKLNTTITPIPVSTIGEIGKIDKLFSEPDKKKMNIFKKISNVKNEKQEKCVKEEIKQESRGSSPDLVIDEPDDVIKLPNLPRDITIERISAGPNLEKMENYFDGGSPGTPSRPKTPEMISPSPPMVKEKRKRKEGKRPKKVPKQESPQRIDDTIDLELERPKTPEAQGLQQVINPLRYPHVNFPFPFGPGLIPQYPANPLLPNPLFSSINLPNFAKKGFLPPIFPQQTQSKLIKLENELNNEEQMRKTDDYLHDIDSSDSLSIKSEKKSKEHKKEKKDKLKKRNKKDKIKNKVEKKKLKDEKKEKKEKIKKEKRKDKEMKEGDHVKITLKIKSPSPRPETPETTRKLNIKPIVKKEEEGGASGDEREKRETSPGLAKFSALVCGPPKPKLVNPPPAAQPAEDATQDETAIVAPVRSGPGPGRPRIHPIKTKPPKPKKHRAPVKKDNDGNEVWICPACHHQDDGSPMIGCDGCDAWYHWVCVGIQVPPDENEDWYCRDCLLKKNEDLQSDKQKKKRKKKEKKEH